MTGTELARRSAQAATAANVDLMRAVPKTPWMMRIEGHPYWETLAQLRVTLRTGVVLRFRVRDLLALKEGQVFESLSPATDDVPVMVGQTQLGWSEFEVQAQTVALRLTRLG
ncbi:MAG: surface presentation of antigen (SpoA) protein [Edaphobacter sp.]|nr:surface presentation of antigen (SpoA) protein [Edaphobacter sp.]